MRKLMISLDKKILDPASAVAQRMIEYGKEDELFIIIPDFHNREINLFPTVHVFTSWGRNKFFQFRTLYKAGTKLLKRHKFDSITSQDPFFVGLIAILLGAKFKLQVEIQVHGDFYSSGYYRQSSLMNLIRYYLGKFVLRKANFVRVVSERIRQSLLRLRIDNKKISIRPIDVGQFSNLRNNHPVVDLHIKYPSYRKIFLWGGRFDPVKNIPWLIRCFSEVVEKHPDYLLLLVGAGGIVDGAVQQFLTNMIKQSGCDRNIIIEPWVLEKDFVSYLATLDCLLFPSLSEGYGLVAMEANAAGTPVIMNDVGVANYELKSSDRVKILPINDKEAWLKAILEI